MVLMSALVGEDVARELTYCATVFGRRGEGIGLVTRVMDDPSVAAMKSFQEIITSKVPARCSRPSASLQPPPHAFPRIRIAG